jgi:hypothetical protein
MAVSYRIDPDRKVVYTTFAGAVTDQEIVRHARKIGSDPNIDGSFVELIQVDTSSMEGVSASGAREVSDALSGSTAIRKIGIVASRNEEFGLARMVELLAGESPIEIEVFREEAAARVWLGIG